MTEAKVTKAIPTRTTIPTTNTIYYVSRYYIFKNVVFCSFSVGMCRYGKKKYGVIPTKKGSYLHKLSSYLHCNTLKYNKITARVGSVGMVAVKNTYSL